MLYIVKWFFLFFKSNCFENWSKKTSIDTLSETHDLNMLWLLSAHHPLVYSYENSRFLFIPRLVCLVVSIAT
jgi:hypothetical protein